MKNLDNLQKITISSISHLDIETLEDLIKLEEQRNQELTSQIKSIQEAAAKLPKQKVDLFSGLLDDTLTKQDLMNKLISLRNQNIKLQASISQFTTKAASILDFSKVPQKDTKGQAAKQAYARMIKSDLLTQAEKDDLRYMDSTTALNRFYDLEENGRDSKAEDYKLDNQWGNPLY